MAHKTCKRLLTWLQNSCFRWIESMNFRLKKKIKIQEMFNFPFLCAFKCHQVVEIWYQLSQDFLLSPFSSPSLELCLRPSCLGSPCPTLLWYLPALPQMEGTCHLCSQTEGIVHRPLALKLLSLPTTSFLRRDPWSGLLLSKSGSDIVHRPHPSRQWLGNIKSLIFCLQQSLLFNSSLLLVQSVLKWKKKNQQSTLFLSVFFLNFFFLR